MFLFMWTVKYLSEIIFSSVTSGCKMKCISFKGFILRTPWITPPVLKQCFVTAGVSLNTGSIGLVLAFTLVLEQLKLPGSSVPIDDEEASWIASISGIFAFPGAILVIPIMGRYGRRIANLVSIIIFITSWGSIIFAPNIAVLLIARALQGINMGMCITLGPLLIGEYTSPRHRGTFFMTMSVSVALCVIFAHAVASLIGWRMGALLCGSIAVIDLVIVFLSPESPSWLASQGRYEECRRTFQWLRGEKENEELDKMIQACRYLRNSNVETASESIIAKVKKNLIYFVVTVRKQEFYKPLLIVGHLYTMVMWSGINVLVGYPDEYLQKLNGYKESMPFITTSLDIHRLLACILSMYIIKKLRRRVMLFAAISLNVFALIVIAVYSYVRQHYPFSFDHPVIGIFLSHLLMLPISAGTLPLPYAIAGEIFPLKDKNLAGGIATLIYSLELFVNFKITPFFLEKVGLCLYFCLYAVILIYSLIVVWFLLPETKDRTLQDIEEEFRGKPICQDDI